MAKFTPQDIQELRKDFQPIAQVLTSLPSVKQCIDKQIVVVNNNGISVYWYSNGVFTLLASTSGNTVTSVFGRRGAVTAQKGDYTAEMIAQDENNRFVTDAEIANWNSATTVRNQSGSASVTSGVAKTVTFTTPFASTPTVIGTFCGADGSSSAINSANLTISTTGFTMPLLDIIQNGTIYWSAGV